MPLQPLRPTQFHPDAVIHASARTTNHAPAPTGVGNTASTLGSQGSSDGCCSLIGKRFLALKERLGDLCLRIKEWVKSWFVSVPPQNNPTPSNISEPDPEPNPPVNNPPQPNPPAPNPPPVNTPPANPVNNLQPTPELILRTFGDEIRFDLTFIKDVFEGIENSEALGGNLQRAEIQARLVRIYDCYPKMVQLYIENKMEELRRGADQEVALVPNWASRIIRNELQYPNEAVPIAGAEESNIFDPNHFFKRAFDDLKAQLGPIDPNRDLPSTLRMVRFFAHYANLSLLLPSLMDEPLEVSEARLLVSDVFQELSQEIQDRVKEKMLQIAEAENSEVRGIPDWAERVIRGEARLQERDEIESIRRHMDILAPDSLFLRAVTDTINEAPLPPTPELIRQTFGEDIRYLLSTFSFVFEFLGDEHFIPADQLRGHRQEIQSHVVAIFDTFPEMVQLNIRNKMEELKREANPNMRLVDNWAHRVLQGQIQYPGEAAPIANSEEMNVLDPNNFFKRAVDSLIQGVGGLPEGQNTMRDNLMVNLADPVNMLRRATTMIFSANLMLFINQLRPFGGHDLHLNLRGTAVEVFDRLPEGAQNQVKDRMFEIAAAEIPEIRQIPNWAERVIRGQLSSDGDFQASWSIRRHIDILDPQGLYLRAIRDVISAAPLPPRPHFFLN